MVGDSFDQEEIHRHKKSEEPTMIKRALDILVLKGKPWFHGCKTWDLPKSPASLIPPSFKRYHISDIDYVTSSSGLVLLRNDSDNAYCYVGNPVSQQWVEIPPPPSDPKGANSSVACLVTRLDEDGVVISFKVVRLDTVQSTNNHLSVFLYSSETGIWTSKVDYYPYCISSMCDINLNGGFVMYLRSLARYKETVLKIWRLNNDDDTWHLLWEVGFPIISNYAPLAMNPFDIGIVYLWSQRDYHWVSCNLRKRNYTILRNASNDGHQDCLIDHFVCKKSVDEIWHPRSSLNLHLNFRVCISFCPFVVPRWMEPVPRPPQAEMIDMTSLLSYATATHERMMAYMRR
ncbi:hypothetical protein Bca4012_045695 [Brassica carinata]